MAMGKRKRHAKQASMWVATQDLPRSVAHPFYARLNQILDQHGFDGFVEGLCERFYADEGRPGLPPGRYLRGHTNILKRLLVHTGGFNLGLLMRQLIGVGTPRGLQGRLHTALAALLALLGSLRELTTRHRRAVRQVSPLKPRSIARFGLVHIGARETAFTTGS
jgi:hypothetical protein